MKQIYLILIGLIVGLFSISTVAFGQETLTYTKADATGWTNDDFGTADKTSWDISGNGLSIGYHGGGGKSGNRNAENWAFSPALELKEVSNFLEYSDVRDGGSGSSFSIMIAKDDNGSVPPRSDFVTVEQWTSLQTTETNQRVDLSSWSGQTVRIAFLRTNELGAGWTVNNIEVVGSNLPEVDNFKVSSITDNSIEVTWTEPESDLEYLLVGADGEVDFKPENGTSYAADDPAGDGTVLMSSASLSYEETGLGEFNSRYYKVWSYDPNTMEYSLAGKTANGTTTGASTIFYEDFEGTNEPGPIDDSIDPDHRLWESGNGYTWTIESANFGYKDEWLINGSEVSYRGSQSAYIVQDGNTVPTYAGSTSDTFEESILVDISAADMDENSYKSAELRFYWKAGGKSGYDYGDVYINDIRMTAGGLTGQTSWKEEVIDVTDYLGQDITLRFYWYNSPDYTGVHDPSYIVDDVMIIGKTVARPQSFSATAINTSQVDLVWDKNAEDQDVIVAYAASGTIGSPDESTSYSVGDMLPGGGEVIYKGGDTSYSHMVESGGQANYKIWSMSTADTYSTSLSASTVMPASLPFFDGFEEEFNWNTIPSVNNDWYRGQAEANDGSYSAYVSKNGGFTTDYDGAQTDVPAILELPVNLAGFSDISVDFDWKLNGDVDNSYGYVQLENGASTYPMDKDGDSNTDKLVGQTTWQSLTDWTISDDTYFSAGSVLRFYMDINGGEDPGFVLDNVDIDGKLKPVTNVVAENNGGLKNNLSWTNAADNLEVVIAEGLNGDAIGELTSGETYYVGDVLPDGGKIVYIGTGESFVHEPVLGGQTYEYKVFQKNGETYSSGVLSNSVTTPENVGFFEDFENGNEKNWTPGSNGGGAWTIGLPANGYDNGSDVAFVSAADGNANYNVNKHDAFTVTMSLTASVENFEDGETFAFDYYWDDGGYVDASASYSIAGGGADQSGTLPTGTAWNTLEVNLSPTATTATVDYTITFTLDIPSSKNNDDIYTPGFLIDNISITGSYDNTSEVLNGAGGQDISSLADNSSSAVEVFTFDIEDKGTSDGKPTDIHQMTFTKGADNAIADWKEVIDGAALYDSNNELVEYGAVQTDGILFDKENLLSVADGTIQSYKLKIWLKETLDTSVDNKALDFTLNSEDIVAYDGSNFSVSVTTAESGMSHVRIVATELAWSVHPSTSAVTGTELTTQPEVIATDANGNIDSDYTEDVALTSDPAGVGGTTTVSAVAGTAAYSDIVFDTADTYILTAASGSLTSVSSQEIEVSDGGGSTSGGTQYIEAVKLAGIENYTYERSTDGYGLFIDQEARMTKGVSYELSISVSGSADLKVYIDYDESTTFEDTEILHDFGTVADEAVQAWVTVPTDKNSGTYRLRVEFVNSSNEGEIEDYTAIVTDNQWTGYTPEWDVNDNWSTGEVPVDNAYIPADPVDGNFFPVLDVDRSIDQLFIENGGKITLKPGVSLFVNTMLDNKGTVELNSTIDAVSALNVPEGNTNSGQGMIELPVKASQWYRLGQPISSPTGAIYDVDQSTSWIYKTKRNYERITENSTSIDPMEGIMVLYENDHTINYSGTLNTGAMTRTITHGNGYYLFSNPYPSAIEWNIDDAVDTGVTISDNLSATIYYRVYAGSQVGDYMITYNGSTGESTIEEGGSLPNGYTQDNVGNISPLQAVWVKVNSSADATINLDNGARITDNSMPLKSASGDDEQYNTLKIVQSNQYISDVAVIYFDETFSEGLGREDSEKMLNSSESVPEVYTRVDGKSLAINGLPSLSGEAFQIPFSVRIRVEGSASIRLNLEKFTESYHVVLEDKETGDWVNMNETDEYNYVPSELGAVHDRFVLHLQKVQEVPTELADPQATEVEGIEIYGQKDFALVKVNPELVRKSPAIIEVMDMTGRRLKTLNSREVETKVTLPDITGAYIIRVKADGKVKSEKVIRPSGR